MTYKTQRCETLLTRQLNPSLPSGTLAKNSTHSKTCQQQGCTQALLLTGRRRAFS